jgi:hypothetical protein
LKGTKWNPVKQLLICVFFSASNSLHTAGKPPVPEWVDFTVQQRRAELVERVS